MEIFEGSYGGRYGKDGMDAVDTLYANTRNNPIEDIESHLPMRVTRYELRENVSGAGRWRGGFGSIRAFQFLADGGFSVEGEGHVFPPWSLDGGKEGWPAALKLLHAAGGDSELASKVPYHAARKGDTFLAIGPSGGGYGDPLERDPERVLADVLDGLITAELAEDDYGVVLSAGGKAVDAEATRRRRSQTLMEV
jgi:N-methylhydantoinase B